jgi:hypothetical protein
MEIKDMIAKKFNKLGAIPGVTIDIADSGKTVHILNKLKHAPDYIFKWIDGTHFVGYFINKNGQKSQAIYSIWDSPDALKFKQLYTYQIELRAKRY